TQRQANRLERMMFCSCESSHPDGPSELAHPLGRSDRSALREVEGSRLGSDARLSSGAERRPAQLETGQRLPEETRSARMTVSFGSSEELSGVPRTPTSGVTWRLPRIHARIAHLTWRRTTSDIRTGRRSDQRAALTAVTSLVGAGC